MVAPKKQKKAKTPKVEKNQTFFQPTADDFVVWFYLILEQCGGWMQIDTEQYQHLPKNIKMLFRHEGKSVIATIPETAKDRKKKSKLILPKKNIITPTKKGLSHGK